jgi:hypothetical protein
MIQDELPEIIRMLRQPAGTDPRFSSFEAIREHRKDFISATHATWKRIHERALDEILRIEAITASPAAKAFPKDFSWFLNYNAALWRRVNDALVWSILGHQDHHIRTLCHRKPRPQLREANPAALRRLLVQVNQDPLSCALWLDATSCVDVGDVIVRSWSGGPNGIFEVKEGKVNERILDLMTSPAETETKLQQIEDFADAFGDKGMAQLRRVTRQMQRTDQVLKIMETDEGFDPYRQAHRRVWESPVSIESYDDVLAELIEKAANGPVLQCIDGCLWVYVDCDPQKSRKDRVDAFSAALFEQSAAVRQWCTEWHRSDSPVDVVTLDGNIFVPEAMPIMLRPLDPGLIQEIVLGGLMDRVLLYFDWLEYGSIIEGLGAKLTWSSLKRGRQEASKPQPQRMMTVGGRIPRIELPNGRFAEGQSKVYRVLFEGVLPNLIARQYLEMLQMERPDNIDGHPE